MRNRHRKMMSSGRLGTFVQEPRRCYLLHAQRRRRRERKCVRCPPRRTPKTAVVMESLDRHLEEACAKNTGCLSPPYLSLYSSMRACSLALPWGSPPVHVVVSSVVSLLEPAPSTRGEAPTSPPSTKQGSSAFVRTAWEKANARPPARRRDRCLEATKTTLYCQVLLCEHWNRPLSLRAQHPWTWTLKKLSHRSSAERGSHGRFLVLVFFWA